MHALDLASLFDASPNAYLVLDRKLHIVTANRAYLSATKRELSDIVGRWAWDAFPTDPKTLKQSIASFERVIRTGEADTMALLRFDIPRPDSEGGGFEERYWSITHSPVKDEAGEVAFVLQHPIDVTELQRLRDATKADAEQAGSLSQSHSVIFSRAQSVHEQNLGLKAESERLRALFEKAPGFICVLSGPEHRFEFVNDSYRRLFGDRGFAGKPARDAFPDLVGQGFFQLLDNVYATGKRHVAQRATVRLKEPPDAPEEERFLDFIYEPIFDEGGRVAGIFVEGHDVTEQVRTEAALRENEERYRQIVEGAEDFAIITFDEKGFITSWNSGARRITGFSDEEALGQPGSIIFTPEDKAAGAAEQEISRARHEGRAPDERWHQRKDGSRFWGSGVMMRRAGGGFLKIFRDRTAEHESEAVLRESEARLARALEAGGLGAWELDLATGAAWRSPQHDRIFGYQEMLPEWTYEMFLRHVVPEDRSEVDARFQEATNGADRWDFECRIRRTDGERRWIWAQATVDRGADGEPSRMKGMVRDITDRKRTEEKLRELNDTLEQRVFQEVRAHLKTEEALRQSQKMEAIGQLTGGVAHDFNNLLTVIRSSADLLRRLELSDDKRRRYLDAISDTADRAAKLTSQLLAFARRQALKPEVLNVGSRVDAIAEMLRTVVGPRVELVTDTKCETCFVEADANQFETALINMAVNARDAMEGQGRLTIVVQPSASVPRVRGHSEAEGAFVSVSLSDTGHGIPPDRIGQIFEPFFTTKEIGRGTGLGLSQVYGFAKQSGGEVSVESRVGEGTTFTLYLPRVEPPAKRDAASRSTGVQSPQDGHILVVEDNEQVGAFSTQLLAELGYETTWAANGDAALQLLEEDPTRYAAIFSDVVMPGMSGVDLGREVRRRLPELPVVLTSGYSHVLAQEGSHGFELLHKPYSVEELTRVLRKAIREGAGA